MNSCSECDKSCSRTIYFLFLSHPADLLPFERWCHQDQISQVHTASPDWPWKETLEFQSVAPKGQARLLLYEGNLQTWKNRMPKVCFDFLFVQCRAIPRCIWRTRSKMVTRITPVFVSEPWQQKTKHPELGTGRVMEHGFSLMSKSRWKLAMGLRNQFRLVLHKDLCLGRFSASNGHCFADQVGVSMSHSGCPALALRFETRATCWILLAPTSSDAPWGLPW